MGVSRFVPTIITNGESFNLCRDPLTYLSPTNRDPGRVSFTNYFSSFNTTGPPVPPLLLVPSVGGGPDGRSQGLG